MLISDVYRFNKSLKQINEWNNYKHKLFAATSRIIKEFARALKSKYPEIEGKTSRQIICNGLLEIRKQDNGFSLTITDKILPNYNFVFEMEKSTSSDPKFGAECDDYNETIHVYFYPYENIEIFKEKIFSPDFFETMKENINHEVTHALDKKVNLEMYVTPGKLEEPFIFVAYVTQPGEMRAIIQGVYSRVNKNLSFIDALKKRIADLKDSFLNQDFLYEHILKSIISFIYYDDDYHKRYWHKIKKDKDIKKYVCEDDDILLFNEWFCSLARRFKNIFEKSKIELDGEEYTLFGYKDIPLYDDFGNDLILGFEDEFKRLDFKTMTMKFKSKFKEIDTKIENYKKDFS